MLYRGQAYGEPVGEWWCRLEDEAISYAMSRGGNRSYVVLALDEDDESWLNNFLIFPDKGWYRIPIRELDKRWSGVKILSGAIDLSWKGPKTK